MLGTLLTGDDVGRSGAQRPLSEKSPGAVDDPPVFKDPVRKHGKLSVG